MKITLITAAYKRTFNNKNNIDFVLAKNMNRIDQQDHDNFISRKAVLKSYFIFII